MGSLSRREFLQRAAALGLGAAGVGVLNACAGPAATPAPAGGPTTPPITEITYWQAPIWRYGKDNETPNAPIDEWINDSIVRFEADNPDIKVHLELIPWDQWGAKVNTALASGTLPNLLYGYPQPQWALAGVYEPLDEFITDDIRNEWAPYMLEAATLYGHVYGIPTFTNPNMYALSKTALEKHGGAEYIPTDELRHFTIQSLEKMAAAFSDGQTRYAIGIPVGDHPAALYFDLAQAFLGRGVAIWNEDQSRFIAHENPRAVETLQWFVDAQNKGWIIPNLPKWSDVDTFYWTLNCAARGQWAGIQTELETAQAAGQAPAEFEIVLVSHPFDEALKPHLAGAYGGGGFTAGKTDDPKKKEAAFRLGNWYGTDPSNGVGWLVNGFFPTSKSQVAAVAGHRLLNDPNKRWVLDVYMQKYEPEPITSYLIPFQNPDTARVVSEEKIADYTGASLMQRHFQSLLLGQLSPEQMLMDLATKINTALGVPV